MFKIIKNYRDDEPLRRSFNALARETFGLDFEPWYRQGFWTDAYAPYSVLLEGRVVANVSVNRTDMWIDGRRRRLYQLGTVMTAEDCRNRGYIRAIMAEIEKDIADADGVYLFANDSVVDFYPKFGFVRGQEHVYSRPVDQSGSSRMKQVPMDKPAAWERLSGALKKSEFATACHMVGNPGLIFFYVAGFMQDCVYYDEELGAWAIAELEDGVLTLHNVFSARDITTEDVIRSFGGDIKRVILGFTPADTAPYICEELLEEDCNFFVRGEAFRDFADRKLRIPSLSHA